MQVKIEAFQVAESFNIKKIRAEFSAILHSSTTSELFYFFEDTNNYLYIFDYGVVTFGNYDAIGRSEFLRFIKPYSEQVLKNDINEQYLIEEDEKITKFIVRNDYVTVPEVTPSVLRISMLNVAQSVALDYYETLTDELINSTKRYTQELELKGKISISKIALLKYIGRVLNVKHSIVDNLYILDDPNLVWDNDDLNQLNRSLKANFETNNRFKDLDYRLRIVEDNLKLFTDVLNHRESARLEWIVIILILIEILNAVFFSHIKL
jgi:required for meiotic nuclear division protein 1